MTDIKIEYTDGDEGIDVETCLAQLAEPAVILAEALYRVHQADAAQATIDALPPWLSAEAQTNADRLLGRQAHLADTADTLSYIAKTAADMAAQDRSRVMTAVDDFLDDPEGQAASVETLRPYTPEEIKPQAVTGIRFTAELQGGYHYLGVVANHEWVFYPAYGFIDIVDFAQVGASPGDGFTVSGRVVSATPDHILGITDGGSAITLPRALVDESADE